MKRLSFIIDRKRMTGPPDTVRKISVRESVGINISVHHLGQLVDGQADGVDRVPSPNELDLDIWMAVPLLE